VVPFLLAVLIASAPAPTPDAAPTADSVARLGLGDPRLRPPALRPLALSLSFGTPPSDAPASLAPPLILPRELSRTETTLKGVGLAANTAMFLGALSANWGWWDEEASWWMIGGAAAAGALYGNTLGWGNERFRIEAQVREDDAGSGTIRR